MEDVSPAYRRVVEMAAKDLNKSGAISIDTLLSAGVRGYDIATVEADAYSLNQPVQED